MCAIMQDIFSYSKKNLFVNLQRKNVFINMPTGVPKTQFQIV